MAHKKIVYNIFIWATSNIWKILSLRRVLQFSSWDIFKFGMSQRKVKKWEDLKNIHIIFFSFLAHWKHHGLLSRGCVGHMFAPLYFMYVSTLFKIDHLFEHVIYFKKGTLIPQLYWIKKYNVFFLPFLP